MTLQPVQNLIEKVGSDRVVMGSDYPVGETDPLGFVDCIAGLSKVERDRIKGGSAAGLLGLD